jgi:hypothetical protein
MLLWTNVCGGFELVGLEKRLRLPILLSFLLTEPRDLEEETVKDSVPEEKSLRLANSFLPT